MRQMFKIILCWLALSLAQAAPMTKTECLDFFQQTVSEQIAHFKNLGIEEQYGLYIFGTQIIHPPATYLARTFAQRGEDVLPFLRARLVETNDVLTVRDILEVLVEYKREYCYNFSIDDRNLFNEKARAVQGPWQKIVQASADELQ